MSSRDDEGRLQGLCCFEFRTWFEAHFTVAVRDKRFCYAARLRAMFTALFSRAMRVTALIEPGNDIAIRQAKHHGLPVEGYCRMASKATATPSCSACCATTAAT